ncbi:hypothetical protein KSZ_74980 [Dictyobacter formicarum]|uniref:Uncharacterized protein n=1 Tax=Dictyobacter formicarum TaxID=2778368 RepID=A0ABQ3VT85_9CHLR|nr:hypothetical protein KSZ_74980 [Dictyobacter formicarum]
MSMKINEHFPAPYHKTQKRICLLANPYNVVLINWKWYSLNFAERTAIQSMKQRARILEPR